MYLIVLLRLREGEHEEAEYEYGGSRGNKMITD